MEGKKNEDDVKKRPIKGYVKPWLWKWSRRYLYKKGNISESAFVTAAVKEFLDRNFPEGRNEEEYEKNNN